MPWPPLHVPRLRGLESGMSQRNPFADIGLCLLATPSGDLLRRLDMSVRVSKRMLCGERCSKERHAAWTQAFTAPGVAPLREALYRAPLPSLASGEREFDVSTP